MKAEKETRLKTIYAALPDIFDRRVNEILSSAESAEVIINSKVPYLAHILYTERKADKDDQ